MVFSSPIFVFAFLPAVLAAYFAVPRAARNHVALAFSFFFYAWGAPQFIAVVLLSGLFDWGLVRRLHATEDARRRKLLASAAIATNLLLLGYFKYIDFAVESANALAAWVGLPPLPMANVALPIGISFIVFEKITYVVDVYRREGSPSRSFLNYALYVFYFPQLIAGPIIKYHDIEHQLRERDHTRANAIHGMARFSLGLAKKVLIADSLGDVAEPCFGAPTDQLLTTDAWLGMLCYTLQIYFDFSGYSDMAIGMARAMGFRFHENFNAPYISQSFTEFWRRWHISLSSWIKSYLYIPLGGSRRSNARTYANLCICFLLSGLWHGANWTFVCWGAYHGAFLVLDRALWLRAQRHLPRTLNVAITFLLVMLGWVIFRADTLPHALGYLRALAPHEITEAVAVYATHASYFYLVVGLLFSFLPAMPWFHTALARLQSHRRHTEWAAVLGITLLLLSAGKMASVEMRPFLYFRF